MPSHLTTGLKSEFDIDPGSGPLSVGCTLFDCDHVNHKTIICFTHCNIMTDYTQYLKNDPDRRRYSYKIYH